MRITQALVLTLVVLAFPQAVFAQSDLLTDPSAKPSAIFRQMIEVEKKDAKNEEDLRRYLAPSFFLPTDQAQAKLFSAMGFRTTPAEITLSDSSVFPKAFLTINMTIYAVNDPDPKFALKRTYYAVWRFDGSWKMYDIVSNVAELSHYRGTGEFISRSEIDSLYDKTSLPLIIKRSQRYKLNYIEKYLLTKDGDLLARTECDTLGTPLLESHFGIIRQPGRMIIKRYTPLGEVSFTRKRYLDSLGHDTLAVSLTYAGDTIGSVKTTYDVRGRETVVVEKDSSGFRRIGTFQYDDRDSLVDARYRTVPKLKRAAYTSRIAYLRDSDGRPIRVDQYENDILNFRTDYRYPTPDSVVTILNLYKEGAIADTTLGRLNPNQLILRSHNFWDGQIATTAWNTYEDDLYLSSSGVDDMPPEFVYSYPRGYIRPRDFNLANSLFWYHGEWGD